MSVYEPVNLKQWVEENRHLLKPPVGNKMVWKDERDTIIMIVGGPNARKDYHINATEEFFYQIEGDITLGIIDEAGEKRDITIREGEIYLLPANVPHSPQRPAGTIGMVVEQKRPEGVRDQLRFYCDECGEVLHEAEFTLTDIAAQLKRIMEEFWDSEEKRTCDRCGALLQPPPSPAGAGADASTVKS